MGDVVLFIDDVVLFIEETELKNSISRCRICHEEEAESYFEAPCSCSGTIKFAHRDCIQRWCDEKGNTICEICLQEYKPGFTTTSKPCRLIETSVTIREDLHIERRETRRRRERRLVERTESNNQECNSDSCCRYLALFFSVILLIKHALDVIYGTYECPFTIFTVLALKAIGILLPMLVIIQTIAAIQRTIQYHQYLESEEDSLSSEEEEDNDLEEDEEDEEQQQHLA